MKSILNFIVSFGLLIGIPGIPTNSLHGQQINSTNTINIWHQLRDAQVPAFEQILTDYETAHPDVTINLIHSIDLIPSLQATIPLGIGPDIVMSANDIIGNRVSENHIIDLNQFGVTNTWLSDTYTESAVNGVTYNGKIWALPESVEGIALVYNKAVVSPEYLPTDPLDFSDLRLKAQAYKSLTGKTLICNQGFSGIDAYHIAPIFFGFGVPSYIDELGNVYANTSEAINAATWLSTMPELSLAIHTYDICNNALKNGDIGMWWTGPWALSELNESGVDYGIVPMGKPFVGIRSLMITTNALERDQAVLALDIIQYITNTANSKSITLENYTIPANKNALNDAEVQAIPSIAGFGQALKIGIPMSPSLYSGCQWNPIGDAVTAIWAGTKTPIEAMNLAQQQIEDCVSSMSFTPRIYLPLLIK